MSDRGPIDDVAGAGSAAGSGARPVAALAGLFVHSARNRLLALARRLRKPRYAVIFVVGLLYFAVVFGPSLLKGGEARTPPPGWSLELIALGLLVLAVLWWTRGKSFRAVALNAAEVDMLLPAPIRRRALITFKLARAQLAILPLGAFYALFAGISPLPWALRFASLWVLLSTLHLHQVAASLVRAATIEQRGTGLRRQWPALVLFGGVVGFVGLGVVRAWPDMSFAASHGEMEAALVALGASLRQPPTSFALWIPRTVLAPGYAPDAAAWLRAMPLALLVLAAHYVWVLRTDTAFEEGAAEAGRKADRVQGAMRRGGMGAATLARLEKAGPPAFRLRPTGDPATALVWKNLTLAKRVTPLRTVLWLLVLSGAGYLVFTSSGTPPDQAALATGFVMLALGGFGVAFGSLAARNDLRADLKKAELLRTYPIEAETLVAAEIRAATVALTLGQLAFLLIGAALTVPFAGRLSYPGPTLAAAAAALVALPALNAMALTAQNALALYFPAWVSLGVERPAGVEAMGHMMVTLLTTVLVLTFGLLFPVVAAALVAAVLWPVIGPWVGAPAILVLGAALQLESTLGIAKIREGWERFDVAELGAG